MGLNRVLVVDDDQESRDLLSEVLNANGYSVEVAEDGEGLWKALGAGDGKAVILVDLRMPGENGLELIRKLQEKKIACDAILMTSFITGAEHDLARKLGVRAFLEKPFRLSELLRVVSEVAKKNPIGISS
ncbi:MAG TPA: response regulator [Terriglobia bacterium]|nr:response regulator [Terriglobia bacterium]